MKLRKLLALSIALTLMTCSFSPLAFAKDEKGLYYTEICSPVLYASNGADGAIESLAEYVDTDALKAYILEALKTIPGSIDIRGFNIPAALSSAVSSLIWYNMPEAFCVNGIGFSKDVTTLYSVILTYWDYADTVNEYKECLTSFREESAVLLDGIKGNEELSDVNKALLLHDRLAIHTEYDFNSTDTIIKHTAYGAFCNKAAVCQGYAMAYMYLLGEVGIRSTYCSSNLLNHAWNIVYLDGFAYHVDVTWDDAAWYQKGRGVVGRVGHENFLRSTEGIDATGHNTNDFDSTPTDKTYDSFFWQNSDTQFCLINDEIYYIDSVNEKLMKMGKDEPLADVSGTWSAKNGYFYVGNYSCLASAGNCLLFSSPDRIFSYNLITGDKKTVFTPSLSSGYSVFGFTYENGDLVLDVNDTFEEHSRLYQIRSAYSVNCSHVFEKNTDSRYLVHSADCISVAKYRKSCSFCGEASQEEFEYGAPDLSKHNATVITQAVKATCISGGFTEGKYCNNCRKYVSGHKDISVDANNHTNTVKTKAVEATSSSVGYTEGVYCNDCKKYVSGHKEIPVKPAFTDSKSAEYDGEFILVTAGLTVKQLLSQASDGAVIRTAKGNELSSDELPGTGMSLVFMGGKEASIVVLGDIDGDGKLSAADARNVLRASVGLEKYEKGSVLYKAAKVGGGAVISASDARLILRASVRLEDPADWMKLK